MLKIIAAAILLAAVAIPSILFATQGNSGTEARVAAYKHDDGRTEFAIQVKEGDRWGERLQPSARYLPADVSTGRWLVSSPVTVAAATESILPIRSAPMYSEDRKLAICAGEWICGPESFITAVVSTGETNHWRIASAQLAMNCGAPGWRDMGITLYDSERQRFSDIDWNAQVDVLARSYPLGIDGELHEEWKGTYAKWQDFSNYEAIESLRRFTHLYVQFRLDDGAKVTATWGNLKEFFETPVQPNIDRCGEYDVWYGIAGGGAT